ncbi:DUF1016 domain-containing protein [Candidatus Woesearchaeota archaeon]|nr:DUF1016 domain-containing protein [Candidatus Woesearchaeota archaeon]
MEKDFLHIVSLIQSAKKKALATVNTNLIDLYWAIGAYISKKIKTAQWGESVVTELSFFISNKYPHLRGYSDKNLWRMKQFYDLYKQQSKLSALLRQISWTNNLLILSKAKTIQEREFYIRLSIKENYSSRELERQIDSGYFERSVISRKKISAVMRQKRPELLEVFKDTYIFDFLDLPKDHSEKDLQIALLNSFKDFVLEFGRDFAFVGEEYRIQVGNNDYFIDLLFYHRSLQCLVAFELKIEDFKPEFLGKLNFYLEALDRNVKKKHENPSVGILLCKSKDDEVVEYALSRSLSPTLISEYKTKLINKQVLQKKLHELYLLTKKQGDE